MSLFAGLSGGESRAHGTETTHNSRRGSDPVYVQPLADRGTDFVQRQGTAGQECIGLSEIERKNNEHDERTHRCTDEPVSSRLFFPDC